MTKTYDLDWEHEPIDGSYPPDAPPKERNFTALPGVMDCKAQDPELGFLCTRPDGHLGQHVAMEHGNPNPLAVWERGTTWEKYP